MLRFHQRILNVAPMLTFLKTSVEVTEHKLEKLNLKKAE
jgi:hypothetical protein